MPDRPSRAQLEALRVAQDHGYVRPASPTHARIADTTIPRLTRTVRACADKGWLHQAAGGCYELTNIGRDLLPTGDF